MESAPEQSTSTVQPTQDVQGSHESSSNAIISEPPPSNAPIEDSGSRADFDFVPRVPPRAPSSRSPSPRPEVVAERALPPTPISPPRDAQFRRHSRPMSAFYEATPLDYSRNEEYEIPPRPLSRAQTVAGVHVTPLTAVNSGPYPQPIFFQERDDDGNIRPIPRRERHTSNRQATPRPDNSRRASAGSASGGGNEARALSRPVSAADLRRSINSPSDRRLYPNGIDTSQIPYDPNGHLNGDATSLMSGRESNVKTRLRPTQKHAEDALRESALQAKVTSWSLNIAIALQVVLGAFTTGVAAAGSSRHTAVTIAILGGLSTLCASYLARARGSGEPEASSLRCRDLQHFVRELEGVIADRGDLTGNEQDGIVLGFRTRFEEIMGNTPPGVNLGGIMRDIHERWGNAPQTGASPAAGQSHDRERGVQDPTERQRTT